MSNVQEKLKKEQTREPQNVQCRMPNVQGKARGGGEAKRTDVYRMSKKKNVYLLTSAVLRLDLLRLDIPPKADGLFVSLWQGLRQQSALDVSFGSLLEVTYESA
jgi:hypothetical protein